MATYLATVGIGGWTSTGRTPAGIPSLTAVDPGLRPGPTPPDHRPDRPGHRLLGRTFGRYPFGSTGAIVDESPTSASRWRPRRHRSTGSGPTRHPLPRAGAPVVRGQRLGPDLAGHLARTRASRPSRWPVGRAHRRPPTLTRPAGVPEHDRATRSGQSIADPQRDAMFSAPSTSAAA